MRRLRPHRLFVCWFAWVPKSLIWFDLERLPLNARYHDALNAARHACEGQDHPQGCLYMLATPIGNLADISLRGLALLQQADVLACEDTRHSQQMLRQWGLVLPHAQWCAVHQHNEAQAAEQLIVRLQQGQKVVYLSDAGTPGISDPGARLVQSVQAAGFRVIPLPGASSLTALLSVTGLSGDGRFVFHGFLPTASQEREQRLQAMSQEPLAQVFLEAPHRMSALARDLQSLGERPLTVGRELTKQFEEVALVSAQDLGNWLAASPTRLKGEFALVLHPLSHAKDNHAQAEQVLTLLLAELPLKTAVKLAAQISGAPRNKLYEQALRKKTSGDDAH